VSVFLPYLSNIQNPCPILYRHSWPVRMHHIFPHYLTCGTIFGK